MQRDCAGQVAHKQLDNLSGYGRTCVNDIRRKILNLIIRRNFMFNIRLETM